MKKLLVADLSKRYGNLKYGAPTASGKAALSRRKIGVHPAGRRVPWPADLRSSAASSTDAVLEIV